MTRQVVIAGASGLIGTALTDRLRERGDSVTKLVRRPPERHDEREWDPAAGRLEPDAIEGADTVICLSGASVGRLPWTHNYRKALVNSRLDSTRTITDAIAALGSDAPAFISASAVGFYGSVPGAVVTEQSPPGQTFLAKLCIAWEAMACRIESVTPVTLLRTAPILDPKGVLAPMIALTRLGAGGPLGAGTQKWPWITLEDEVRAILHVIDNNVAGPVNLAAPDIVTQNDIGLALAGYLERPYWLPAPEWTLKTVLSPEAVTSMLTVDADVRPSVLEETGFVFEHPELRAAIVSTLG
ncbi:TIGR01777 family oxidoreductase [uncultured Agrococcus sp.]|uniref:TIGR01777 family oxidoreductase n=1 Tax=uncultured Agrococcus sp. TaxID=382258 RepID=UPI0025EC1555|nr:TIGR01777 family oxidoreductase [uncultured Agrococcus sp.]